MNNKNTIITIIITALVVVAICMGSFAIYDKFFKDKGSDGGLKIELTSDDESGQNAENSNEQTTQSNLKDVAVDDQRVISAIAPFHSGEYFSPLGKEERFGFFYSKDKTIASDLSIEDKKALAIGDLLTDNLTNEPNLRSSFSKDELSQYMKKIFGDSVTYNDSDITVSCIEWKFNSFNNLYEQGEGGCGGTLLPFLESKIIIASEDDNTLQIVEKILYSEAKTDGNDVTRLVYTNLDKTTLIGEYTNVNIDDLLDKLDSYKWTFRKEGSNFVFESVEKVK